ncbi:fatty acid desaturase [Candidatus Comchoanobacter bicostacola]|uniref:Fatty acid desaturase n=1 Tax=Candidatus Comchoanobacter bicostacola TaxID=2919598 RepID=A0ABY5DK26_9GAMM|nr:fatty acid desaturase [Candidatus Comchoanobacter bicostacola]UTC24621.1 fatty acid desaturase [Candidatus Comchoanobacter bicostacola]
MQGLFQLSHWQVVLCILGLTHVTMIAVTLYLHRSMSHKACTLHPVVAHFFRFWLWLTTGMTTKEWVAVHRKHHAHVETSEDPHSPQVYGIWAVLLSGVWLYRRSAQSQEVLSRYGHDCPDDWIERHVYRIKGSGVILTLCIDLYLWGTQGLIIWVAQMLWVPLTAAGIINGVGHYLGYRNFESKDASCNIIPWGVFIAGEELHNNHHAYPRSAKLSSRPFEFDLGYVYLKILVYLGLAKVCYVMPARDRVKAGLASILNERMLICREYSIQVLSHALKESYLVNNNSGLMRIKRLKRLLFTHPQLLKEQEKHVLTCALSFDDKLAQVYKFRAKLYAIFYHSGYPDRMASIKDWCKQARDTQIELLIVFASWVESRYLEGVVCKTQN